MFALMKKLWILLRGSHGTEVYRKIIEVNEQPNRVPEGTLVLVMGGDTPKWLKLTCPCGCGAEYSLPLMSSMSPHWQVIRESDGTISVYPSIDVTSLGCGAHFWIKQSKVVWAGPRPRNARRKMKSV